MPNPALPTLHSLGLRARTLLALAALAPALLLAGCDAGAAGGAGAVAGPLQVEQARHDFGQVFEGALLEHQWEIRVREALAVNQPKTDCGCTLALLEREGPAGRAPYVPGEPLAAGERLHLRVRYDTRGRRGPSARSVTVTSTSGAALRLGLEADIRPWLLCEPSKLAFERLREGQGAARELRVWSVGGEPFGLKATRSALPPWVTVELEPESPAESTQEGGPQNARARAWRVRVALLPEAPRGTFSYPIELESDVLIAGPGEERRAHTIAPGWVLQVVGPVALSTPSLDFGLVRGEEVVARALQLESFEPGFSLEGASARLENLRPDEPFLLARTARVHLHPEEDGVREIEVTLAGLDPELRGTFLARLVVDTGHPTLPQLQALVRGVRVPDGDRR